MTLYKLFTESSKLNPTHKAIVTSGEDITFAELYYKVQTISNALSNHGCKSGMVVGVCIHPSIDYVVVTLAINKLSATFFPIDPQQPKNRLQQIFDIVDPQIIVSSGELKELMHELVDKSKSHKKMFVTSDLIAEKRIMDKGFDDHDNAELPIDTAYVIYTSGSTGVPKIIKGSCNGLVHFLRWEIERFNLNVECKVVQLAPISFDVSLRDIFIPLCCGGTLL